MSPDRGAFLALVLSAVAAMAPIRAHAAKLVPDGFVAPVAIEISDNLYLYYPVTAGQPLVFTVEGPASFEAIVRWRFDDTDPVDVEVELSLDGRPRTRHVFRAVAGTAVYPDDPGARAGRPMRLTLDDGVPAGTHVVRVTLVRPLVGALDMNPLSTPAARPALRLAGEVVLGAAYESNIFRYSDADVEDFLDGERPERFPIESMDDVRFEPRVVLSLDREEPGVRSTTLALETNVRLAAVNAEKSFAKFAVGLRERRDGVAYLSLRYEAIPDYHIRALWDADAADEQGAYRSCNFGKQGFGVPQAPSAPRAAAMRAVWTRKGEHET